MISAARLSTPRQPSLVDYASSVAEVSAFCRAAMKAVIPNDIWGQGSDHAQNLKQFLSCVDKFIGLRRFESLSLHEVLQGMKVSREYSL